MRHELSYRIEAAVNKLSKMTAYAEAAYAEYMIAGSRYRDADQLKNDAISELQDVALIMERKCSHAGGDRNG